jgi:hypothetical protein
MERNALLNNDSYNYIGCPSSKKRQEQMNSYSIFLNTNSSHNYLYIPNNYDYSDMMVNKNSFKQYINNYLRNFKIY